MEPGDEVKRLSYNTAEAQRAVPEQEGFSDHEESSDYSDGAEEAPAATRRRVYDPGNARRRRRRPAWSRLEEAILAKQHSIRGNSWSAIAEHLPGRSASEVKNIWHSTLRSKKLKSRSLLRAYARCLNERGDSASARHEAFRAAVKLSRGVEDMLPDGELGDVPAGKQLSGSEDDEYGVLHATNPPCSGSSDGGCAASITSQPSSPTASALQAVLVGGQKASGRIRTGPPLPGALGGSGAEISPVTAGPAADAVAAVPEVNGDVRPGLRQQTRGRDVPLGDGLDQADLLQALAKDGAAAGEAGAGLGADLLRQTLALGAKGSALHHSQQVQRAKPAAATALAEAREAAAALGDAARVSQRQMQRRQRQHQQRRTAGGRDEEGEDAEEAEDLDEDDEGGRDGGRAGRFKRRPGAARGGPQLSLQLPEEPEAQHRLTELQQLLCLQAARQRAQMSALEALPAWTRRRLEEETQAEAYRFLLRQHLLQRAAGHPVELPGSADGAEGGSGSEPWRLQEEGNGSRTRASLLERVQPGVWGVPPLQALGMWDRLAPLTATGPLSAAAAAAALPPGGPPRDLLAAQLGQLGHLEALGPLAAALAANNAAAVGDIGTGLNPLNPLATAALGGIGVGVGGLSGLDALDVASRLGCGLPGSNIDVMDQLNALMERINADRVLNERLAAAAATQAAAAQAAAAQVAAMQAAAAQAAMQAAAMRLAGLPPGARGGLPSDVGGLTGAEGLGSMGLLPQIDAQYRDSKPYERTAAHAGSGGMRAGGGRRGRISSRDGASRGMAAKTEDPPAESDVGAGPLQDGGDRLPPPLSSRGGFRAAAGLWQDEQGGGQHQRQEESEGEEHAAALAEEEPAAGLHSLAGAAAAAAAALGPTPRASGLRRRGGVRGGGATGPALGDGDARTVKALALWTGEEASADADVAGGASWRRQEDALDHFAAAALLHSGFVDLGMGLKGGRRLKNAQLEALGVGTGFHSFGQRPAQQLSSLLPSRQQAQKQELQDRRGEAEADDVAPKHQPQLQEPQQATEQEQEQQPLSPLQQQQNQQQRQLQTSAGMKRPRERQPDGRSPARTGAAAGPGTKSARTAVTR